MLEQNSDIGRFIFRKRMISRDNHQNVYANNQKFEKALGAGDGQESLVCCSLRGHKESDMTERLD